MSMIISPVFLLAVGELPFSRNSFSECRGISGLLRPSLFTFHLRRQLRRPRYGEAEDSTQLSDLLVEDITAAAAAAVIAFTNVRLPLRPRE